MMSASKRRVWVGALLLAWLVLWFAGAQSRVLLEPDEGRYAEVPREMVATANWVTPRYDEVLFFDKPALQYWGTAIAYKAFGVHDWTARLWELFTGLMTLVMVGWAGTRAFGRVAGWGAAGVLGSSFLWVVGSHIATLDVGVAAFLGLALCAFILAQLPDTGPRAHRAWMLATWAAMAAAFLSKGLIGIVFPGGALFFYMVWTRQWALLRRMEWALGLPLFLLLVLPWFVAVQLRHGQFLDYFFVRQQFTRFLTDRDDRQQPLWFFLPVLVIGFFPWLALLPAALKRPNRQPGFDARKLLWIWTLMIFVFFSVSHSKLPLYLLPVFPAVALLVGDTIARGSNRVLGLALGAAAAMLLLAIPVALRQHVPANLALLAPAFMGYMRLLAMAMGIAASLLMIAAVLGWREHRLASIGVASFAGLGLLQAALIGFQALAPAYSAAPLARAIAPWCKAGTPIYMVDTLERGLPFYLRRPVTLVGQAPYDLRDGLRWEPWRLMPQQSFVRRWRHEPGALAVIAPAALAALRRQGLPMHELARSPRWILIRRPAANTVRAMDNRPLTAAQAVACPPKSKSDDPSSTVVGCSHAPQSQRVRTLLTTRDD